MLKSIGHYCSGKRGQETSCTKSCKYGEKQAKSETLEREHIIKTTHSFESQKHWPLKNKSIWEEAEGNYFIAQTNYYHQLYVPGNKRLSH